MQAYWTLVRRELGAGGMADQPAERLGAHQAACPRVLHSPGTSPTGGGARRPPERLWRAHARAGCLKRIPPELGPPGRSPVRTCTTDLCLGPVSDVPALRPHHPGWRFSVDAVSLRTREVLPPCGASRARGDGATTSAIPPAAGRDQRSQSSRNLASKRLHSSARSCFPARVAIASRVTLSDSSRARILAISLALPTLKAITAK